VLLFVFGKGFSVKGKNQGEFVPKLLPLFDKGDSDYFNSILLLSVNLQNL
jgi:hypothetical protein